MEALTRFTKPKQFLEIVDTLPNLNGTLERAFLQRGEKNTTYLVKQLIKRGADPNTNTGARPPLLCALERRNIEAARLLVAAGAVFRSSIINAVLARNDIDLIQQCDKLGAFNCLKRIPSGARMLTSIRYLVKEKGLDINSKDKSGDTPLVRAVSSGFVYLQEEFEELFKLGADPRIPDAKGVLPIDKLFRDDLHWLFMAYGSPPPTTKLVHTSNATLWAAGNHPLQVQRVLATRTFNKYMGAHMPDVDEMVGRYICNCEEHERYTLRRKISELELELAEAKRRRV